MDNILGKGNVKKTILLFLLFTFISIPAIAEDKKPNLLWEGGAESLIAWKDNFSIEIIDQVGGGCLPKPTRLKDKMEISLRQSGFKIANEDDFLPPVIRIIALGYSTGNESCVVHVESTLTFYIVTNVPFAYDVPSGKETFVPYIYPIGSFLFTGPKTDMQDRIEKQVKDFGDKLYLKISRAKDHVAKNFPEIISTKKKLEDSENTKEKTE